MIAYDILIPAYNAENTLPDLIKSIMLLNNKPGRICVVDDGSSDNTITIAKDLHCHIISNGENMGKGYTLKQGFKDFLQNSENENLICIDADLQHPVNKIPNFLEVIEKYNSSLIIGNREKRLKKMPISRIVSNKTTSWIISKITGVTIKDSQCGFRAIKRELIQEIELKEDGFQMESEFILRVCELNKDIRFIDIPTIYNGQISYIHHFKDTIKFVSLILKEIFKRNV